MITDEPTLSLELAARHYKSAVNRIEAALQVIFPPGFAERIGGEAIGELADSVWRSAMMLLLLPSAEPVQTNDEILAFATRHFLPSLPEALRRSQSRGQKAPTTPCSRPYTRGWDTGCHE